MMEAVTIEQIHRLSKLPLKPLQKLPHLRRLSRDDRASKSCAVKEFRFPPPFAGKKKKAKALPPIPEFMLPKRHNSLEELLAVEDKDVLDLDNVLDKTQVLSEIKQNTDPEQIKHPSSFFQLREFTFPIAIPKSGKKAGLPPPPRLKEATLHLKKEAKDVPLQSKMEKLAKKKRKEFDITDDDNEIENEQSKKLESRERLPEVKGPQYVQFPDMKKTFKLRYTNKRDNSSSPVKQYPFKQTTLKEDPIAPKIPPRLYTKIVDSIYSYSRGYSFDSDDEDERRRGQNERLPVSPVTMEEKEEREFRIGKYLPPIK